MRNFHKNYFFKIGLINANLINIISNYSDYISTAEIDFLFFYYLKILGYKSSVINFNNHNFVSCISLDNVICHGIPIFEFISFKNIKIDLSINNFYHSDSCVTFSHYLTNNFLKKKFFYILRKIKLGFYYSCVGKYINLYLFKKIFNVINYCSHGIYKKLHNNNIILHENNNNKKKIKIFDSFTIEPMYNYGSNLNYHYKKIFFCNNYSFQWEHTLFIYNKKKIITTLRKTEICIYLQL